MSPHGPSLKSSEAGGGRRKRRLSGRSIGIALAVLAALSLLVASVSALGGRRSLSGPADTPAASWRTAPLELQDLEKRAPDEFVYLELIEENSDTFQEQLFKAKRQLLPAPFSFEDGILRVDAALTKASNPELGMFVEAGQAAGRSIVLVHWGLYTGIGRRWDQATYYLLNEPSRSVGLPAYAGGDVLRLTPADSPLDTLQVRLPGESLQVLEAAKDGSVQMVLDSQTFALKPGEHRVLGTQTRQIAVTELTPYGNTIDYGQVTFTTQVSLYNYGSPTAVEFVHTAAAEGGN